MKGTTAQDYVSYFKLSEKIRSANHLLDTFQFKQDKH